MKLTFWRRYVLAPDVLAPDVLELDMELDMLAPDIFASNVLTLDNCCQFFSS